MLTSGKTSTACCHVRWHHHVPWHRRPYAKGDHQLGSLHHENQDHRSPREEILCMDRRLHLGFTFNLPTDVDQQTRIRRIWPLHCSQKMFLILTIWKQIFHFLQMLSSRLFAFWPNQSHFSISMNKHAKELISKKKKKKKKKYSALIPL